MSRTPKGFDPVVHAPNRLQICALLDAVDEMEFSVVRDTLGVSDSVLSKHVAVLSEASYVEQRRAVRNTRQRVWLRLTTQGRNAYHHHVTALRSIIGGSVTGGSNVEGSVTGGSVTGD